VTAPLAGLMPGPVNTSPRGKTVVIIGGGLAGLAAAVRLGKLGYSPVVLEKRPFAGGRAFSFTDPETGAEVDNGQHVFVGACTAYRQFLKDIGAWDNVRLPKRIDAPVLCEGVLARLRGAESLSGPFANLPAILGYTHLSMSGRARVLYGLARIKLTKRLPGGPLERETFHSWLRRHGQNGHTIERFWELITLPALNDSVSAVSADAGLMLFQTALLRDPSWAAIGCPSVGLSSLASAPATATIERAGGQLRCGLEAQALDFSGGRITGVRASGGETIKGEAYVSAVPPSALLALLPAGLAADSFFAACKGVETSPIVNVHIWYGRQVVSEPFIAVLNSPVQWVFNVTALHSEEGMPDEAQTPVVPRLNGAGPSQHIAISLSGAWRWRDMSKTELRETFVTEMERLFPAARGAAVLRFLVVKMLDATFRVAPGPAAFRLPQKTPIPGMFLAGDWTATGWPSTMESAVRSGNLAADAAAAYLSSRAAALGA